MENKNNTKNNTKNNPAACGFGQYIKNLRLNKKLTLRDTERLSGISNSYISQIERGIRSVPTIKILIILAATYGVPSKQVVEQARQFIKKMKREAQGDSNAL